MTPAARTPIAPLRASTAAPWARFLPVAERARPTYLAFESSERLTQYLKARALLTDDRTRG
jgi:hypothetical protein